MTTRTPPRGAWTPDRVHDLLTTLGEAKLREILDLQLTGWEAEERQLRSRVPAWWRPGAWRRWHGRLSRVNAGRAEALRRIALLERVLAAWRETTS